jgi:hypothetical protein
MAERPPSHDELARRLESLAGRLDVPEADLADAVRAAIEARLQPRAAVARPRRRLLTRLALAAAVVLAVALALSPQAREAIAERILQGVQILRIAAPTPTSAPPGPTATAEPLALRLGLGRRVSLDDAATKADFPILLPESPLLGPPDEVYVASTSGGNRVSLVYGERDGLPAATETGVAALVTQFEGDVSDDVVRKGLPPETTVELLDVDGGRAIWIEGAPHFVYVYRAPDGEFHEDRGRLAGNTLLWERGDMTLRLEAEVDRETALRLAGSVR